MVSFPRLHRQRSSPGPTAVENGRYPERGAHKHLRAIAATQTRLAHPSTDGREPADLWRAIV